MWCDWFEEIRQLEFREVINILMFGRSSNENLSVVTLILTLEGLGTGMVARRKAWVQVWLILALAGLLEFPRCSVDLRRI